MNLKEIKERESKAASAPWKACLQKDAGKGWPVGFLNLGESCEDGEKWAVRVEGVHASELVGDAKTDADFIANARTDIPNLVSWVERAQSLFRACVHSDYLDSKTDARIVELLAELDSEGKE